MFFRTYWADSIWRVLRIVTFVTAMSALVILGIYLCAHKSWLDTLAVAVIVNVVLHAALLIRTLIYRAQPRRDADSRGRVVDSHLHAPRIGALGAASLA